MASISIDRNATTAVKSIRWQHLRNDILLLLSWGSALVAISEYNVRVVDIISGYAHRSFPTVVLFVSILGILWQLRHCPRWTRPQHSPRVFPAQLKVFRDRNHSSSNKQAAQCTPDILCAEGSDQMATKKYVLFLFGDALLRHKIQFKVQCNNP